MRSFVFVVGFVIMHTYALAAEKDEISQRMYDYWGTYSRGEFGEAADFILPADLSDMKAELLPVFLAAGQSTDPELRSIAAVFFSEIPVGSRPDMSSRQIFIGLNKFIYAANPQLYSALGQSSIEVTDVALSTNGEAIVSYRLIIQDTPVSDLERFKSHKGQWYMRLKEAPSDTAIKFKQAFGL